MATMRCTRVTEFGDEDKLKLCENQPIPKPSPDEVLIRVKAAGINPVDTLYRTGMFPGSQVPYTPGCDAAGIVEEVGDSVTGFKKGDRVLAVLTKSGSYAEYCTANPIHLCPLQESLSFVQGAAIGVPYYTAHVAIFDKAKTKPGETVLVHGASGAVGIAAVQMLKALGCTVIGTAGTPEGMKLVLEQGADKVFNHREEGYMKKIREEVTSGKGVDVIIEMLANVNLPADLETIAGRGRIVLVGSRGPVEINPILLLLKEASVAGVGLTMTKDDEWKAMHTAINEGQRRGWIKPVVSKAYKLGEVPQSHRDVLYNTGTMGKLVIDTSL